MKILLLILSILAALLIVGWLGLQIKPKSFVPFAGTPSETKTIPLPANLPAPVQRFYKTVYGDSVPVIDTVVITGRGRIRPFGVWLPTRFIFVHNTGRDYRHYFEATMFGIPLLKVNEGYVDGESFFESPMGTYYNDANTNQGANLALWAEAAWFPSIWITDPRVQWKAVDDQTALLYVPFEDNVENFIVRFNPQTSLVDSMEAMRYREPGEGKPRILWITRNEPGNLIDGTPLNASGSATWIDQGRPWAVFALESVKYNVDVSDYIHKRGK